MRKIRKECGKKRRNLGEFLSNLCQGLDEGSYTMDNTNNNTGIEWAKRGLFKLTPIRE